MLFLMLVSLTAFSQEQNEKYYRNIAVKHIHGRTKAVLKDKSHVDIVTDTFAIEIEFAQKWAESIGHSELYSIELHKKAGIVLIADRFKDDEYVQKLMKVATKLNITVWVIFINDNSWGKVESVKEKDGTVKFIY